MSLEPDVLLASLLVGLIGLAVFVYGRKARRAPHLLVGLALMVFPYFVNGVLAMLGIAGVLLAALWGATRLGY